jgi:hypothetical protein
MAVRRILPLLAVLALSLSVVASASARSNSAHTASPVSAPASVAAAPEAEEDAAVLPTRVVGAIRRTETALANAEEHIDEAEYTKAIVSLRAVRQNLLRADKAARTQMKAVPPAEDQESEEAATSPADSVIAVLGLEQEIVVTIADLFNGQSGALVTALSSTISTAQLTRDRMLASVLALNPEGAGADYSDGMADTVGGYTDEVANLAEALANDKLTLGGRGVLNLALTRSKATEAKINSAFGGGE